MKIPYRGVRVRFAQRLDVEAWVRRHDAGEVPDRWPYGLDQLAAHGLPVLPSTPPPADASVNKVLRRFGGYEWMETRSSSSAVRPDLEICWDERVGVPLGWRSRGGGGPDVATGVIWLTDISRTRSVHRAVAGPGLRAAHRVWALSSAQLPVLRDVYGVSESRLAHLLFGVDAEFFRASGGEPTRNVVVSAGNDEHRDHATLLAAMALVRREVASARLELATRHPVAIPDDLGVRHASLTHPAMRGLYQRGQVVVVALLPNLHVSGVTVALEAMACGRPIVISNTPGMSDYVTHGETGLLVPPGDPDALAAAVTELLVDSDRAAALGAAGRKDVEARFTTAAQARRIIEIVS